MKTQQYMPVLKAAQTNAKRTSATEGKRPISKGVFFPQCYEHKPLIKPATSGHRPLRSEVLLEQLR